MIDYEAEARQFVVSSYHDPFAVHRLAEYLKERDKAAEKRGVVAGLREAATALRSSPHGVLLAMEFERRAEEVEAS